MTNFEFVSAWDPFWKFVMAEDSSFESLSTANTKRSGKHVTFARPLSNHGDASSSRDDSSTYFEEESHRQNSGRSGHRPSMSSRQPSESTESLLGRMEVDRDGVHRWRQQRLTSRKSADSLLGEMDHDPDSTKTLNDEILAEYAASADFNTNLSDGSVRDDDIWNRINLNGKSFGLGNFFDFAEDGESNCSDEQSSLRSETTASISMGSTTSERANDDDTTTASSYSDSDTDFWDDEAASLRSTTSASTGSTTGERDNKFDTMAASMVGDKKATADGSALEMTSPDEGAKDDKGTTLSLIFIPDWTGQTNGDSSSTGQQGQHKSINEGLNKDKTRSIVTDRKQKKKAKAGFLRSIKCQGRPVSPRVGEKEHAVTGTDGHSTSSRMEKKQSSSSADGKSCMPTVFGGKLRFDSISEEPRLESKDPDASSHKSCIPIQFKDNSLRAKKHTLHVEKNGEDIDHGSHLESFGKLLCRSHKNLDLDSMMRRPDKSGRGAFPQERIVSDTQGVQKIVARKPTNKPMMPPESHLASATGPQSIFTYEYEKGMPMDVRYKTFGDDPIDLLYVRQYNVPQTLDGGTSEAIIKIEASTISVSDCRIRQGLWWGMEAAPVSNTPGVDMIGKIDKIDALSMLKYKLKPGNRVMSLIKWGGNSRYTRIATDQLVKVPSGVDPAQAVCLAEAYLAAFQALHYTHSHNERYSNHSMIGRSILLIGAMTNVGRAVVELAKALGAMNVYAVGKERHHPMLTTLGVVPLRRDPKLWPAGIMGMMDLVIDATGDSAGDHATASHFCALHERGTLIFIGLRSMTDHVASEWDVSSPWFDADMVAQVINRTHALEVFDNWDLDLERSKRDLEYLLRLLQKEMIDPVIRDILPLGKVAKAQAVLQERRIQGYLVCEPWIKSKSRAVHL